LLFNQKANGMLNKKKFRAIYDDYLESGLTIRDYCLNQKMGEPKFFYWQNKLRGLLLRMDDLLFEQCPQLRQRLQQDLADLLPHNFMKIQTSSI
jgi:hypothetical protein